MFFLSYLHLGINPKNVVLVFVGMLVLSSERQIRIFMSSFIKRSNFTFSGQIFLDHDVHLNRGTIFNCHVSRGNTIGQMSDRIKTKEFKVILGHIKVIQIFPNVFHLCKLIGGQIS